MGSWGFGVFDSDSALDWLGDLAREHARTDEDGDVVAGSVDVPAVTAHVQALLRSCAQADPDEDEDAALAYPAAGLVAAVLSGQPTGPSSGTRLFDHLLTGMAGDRFEGGTDPLGLSAHCGYAALLDRPAALALRQDAVTAVAALSRNSAWLARWRDPQGMRAALTRLQDLLTDAG